MALLRQILVEARLAHGEWTPSDVHELMRCWSNGDDRQLKELADFDAGGQVRSDREFKPLTVRQAATN